MQDAKKANAAAKKEAAPAPPAAPLPPASKDAEVVAASEDDEEAYVPFEFPPGEKAVKYWKNGLQHLYKRRTDNGFGDWVGRYDSLKRKIDTNFPEPPVED